MESLPNSGICLTRAGSVLACKKSSVATYRRLRGGGFWYLEKRPVVSAVSAFPGRKSEATGRGSGGRKGLVVPGSGIEGNERKDGLPARKRREGLQQEEKRRSHAEMRTAM